MGSTGLDRPVLKILADHHEFDLAPEDAVAAGLAPDRAWFIAEKSIVFDGWRMVSERPLNAQPDSHLAQGET